MELATRALGRIVGLALLTVSIAHCTEIRDPADTGTSSDVAQDASATPNDVVHTDSGNPQRDATRTDAVIGPSDTGVGDSGSIVVDSGTADVPTTPVDAQTGDPYDTARDNCVAEINRYRAMLSLTPYERWRDGEACADQMAANDAMTGIAHDGFMRGICPARGNGQNECPGWGGPDALNGCLAQMWAEGPSADGNWDPAHGHYLNMVGDYYYMGYHQVFSRVACGFSAGGWMVQDFQ